jgi:hypothetical protein
MTLMIASEAELASAQLLTWQRGLEAPLVKRAFPAESKTSGFRKNSTASHPSHPPVVNLKPALSERHQQGTETSEIFLPSPALATPGRRPSSRQQPSGDPSTPPPPPDDQRTQRPPDADGQKNGIPYIQELDDVSQRAYGLPPNKNARRAPRVTPVPKINFDWLPEHTLIILDEGEATLQQALEGGCTFRHVSRIAVRTLSSICSQHGDGAPRARF